MNLREELEDYFLNLQNGVLDVVAAGLIIFSSGWVLMMFGFWIKAQKERESTSHESL